MIEKTLTMKNIEGLHSRNAKLLVQVASNYISEIKLLFGEKRVNAKSLVGVLSCQIRMNNEFTLKAHGEDEEQAINALETLVKSQFKDY